jgi:DHA3 family macrolide efflux protein-like MFS transporter
METTKRPQGMQAFSIIWIGQVVSLLGTAMSNFGLTLWAYDQTGKATPLAMIMFFYIAPQVALSPFIGVLVDRGNRRLMMVLSDAAAALVSLINLVLFLTGLLQIWHIYVGALLIGIFNGFQWPSFSASLSLMLPKKHYARANSLLSIAQGTSQVLAPASAGALIGRIGLQGILTFDIAAAAFAVGTLLVIHIPQPEKRDIEKASQGGIWQEITFGFRYIFARPSLLGLQSVYMVGNFFSSMAFAVIAPLILGRTGNNQQLYGNLLSISAIGGVIGGVVMSIWGGPKKRVHGVLAGWILTQLLGQVVVGVGQSLPVWAVGGFLWAFFGPFIDGSNQAIWQSKVDPELQGRVFSARLFIAWLVMPLANLIAGPLVDNVLEPGMAVGGVLAHQFGWLVGTGPGAGAGLLFVVSGVLGSLAGVGGYLSRKTRQVETLLPDHHAIIE